MLKKIIAGIALAALCATLCGCDRDKTADVIDSARSAIGNAIDNAPTGEQILDGIDRITDAVSAGVEEFKKDK